MPAPSEPSAPAPGRPDERAPADAPAPAGTAPASPPPPPAGGRTPDHGPNAAPGTRRDPLERDLVRRLKAQDPRAFEELVRTYQNRVFGLVYRMLGDRHEAEDVAQEVFLSVHRAIGRYRGEGRFQTWLFRIAANACRTRLRHLAHRAAHGAEPLDAVLDGKGAAGAPVADPLPGPEAAAEGRQLEAVLLRELGALDEDQRLLLVLRDLQGLSYQEILSITGLPEGTLKSRLHRARVALKARLRPYLS